MTREVTYKSFGIEKFKDEYFTDSSRLALQRCNNDLAIRERNDCVVRAFMVALDISYNQAHEWVAKMFQRQYKTGTYTARYIGQVANKTKNGYRLKFMGSHPTRSFIKVGSNKKILTNDKYKKPTGYTLKSFLESHPTGRYFLIVQRHAVAVVDGVLYGNPNEIANGLYRSVWYGLECV